MARLKDEYFTTADEHAYGYYGAEPHEPDYAAVAEYLEWLRVNEPEAFAFPDVDGTPEPIRPGEKLPF